MFRRTTIPALLAALALTASAACSNGGGDDRRSAGANPTVATEPPRTTTTDPYAVPAVIDTAYVNRVLAGLDAAIGDVTRLVLQTRTFPREAYDRLRALYGTDTGLQLAIDNLQADLRYEFSGYSDRPGNEQTTVVQLSSVSPTCIFARVHRDYSAIGPGVQPPTDKNWVALRPLDATRDPKKYNPTSWAYHYNGFTPDRSQPANPCANS